MHVMFDKNKAILEINNINHIMSTIGSKFQILDPNNNILCLVYEYFGIDLYEKTTMYRGDIIFYSDFLVFHDFCKTLKSIPEVSYFKS